MKKEVWFKAKHYGWGWYPSSWQGIIILLLAVALILLSGLYVVNMAAKIAVIFLIGAILICICWRTGERPGWRWGK